MSLYHPVTLQSHFLVRPKTYTCDAYLALGDWIRHVSTVPVYDLTTKIMRDREEDMAMI
jgi:hypothetical protein